MITELNNLNLQLKNLNKNIESIKKFIMIETQLSKQTVLELKNIYRLIKSQEVEKSQQSEEKI